MAGQVGRHQVADPAPPEQHNRRARCGPGRGSRGDLLCALAAGLQHWAGARRRGARRRGRRGARGGARWGRPRRGGCRRPRLPWAGRGGAAGGGAARDSDADRAAQARHGLVARPYQPWKAKRRRRQEARRQEQQGEERLGGGVGQGGGPAKGPGVEGEVQGEGRHEGRGPAGGLLGRGQASPRQEVPHHPGRLPRAGQFGRRRDQLPRIRQHADPDQHAAGPAQQPGPLREGVRGRPLALAQRAEGQPARDDHQEAGLRHARLQRQAGEDPRARAPLPPAPIAGR
mmetsp:Transcript_22179/g.66136  ORF Transcript_22179/g.66136 Transcript_22179/m.66136 type:complete len:286 (-) Transcript_22179:1802-2659(-)